MLRSLVGSEMCIRDRPYRTVKDTPLEASTDMYDGPSNDWMDSESAGARREKWGEDGQDGPLRFEYLHDGEGEESVMVNKAAEGDAVRIGMGVGYAPRPPTTIRPVDSGHRVSIRSVRTVVVFKVPCPHPISSAWSLLGDVEVPRLSLIHI
eukprot:TRINITY_DN30201_c0_g1_i2.p1 TRINITY_DN30201_c0_g1~~TRINITY_DN30201_c0_g1_i2.p1  ORF type:complete len:151 (-),score=33.06 TRINITY_DN30201_c0_g1_i2:128-580(-)